MRKVTFDSILLVVVFLMRLEKSLFLVYSVSLLFFAWHSLSRKDMVLCIVAYFFLHSAQL